VLAVADFRRSMLAAWLMSGMFFAIAWVWRQTRHTFRLTRELEEEEGRNGADSTGRRNRDEPAAPGWRRGDAVAP
jgi:hypothetical protein